VHRAKTGNRRGLVRKGAEEGSGAFFPKKIAEDKKKDSGYVGLYGWKGRDNERSPKAARRDWGRTNDSYVKH